MTAHHLTHAKDIFYGDARYARAEALHGTTKRGLLISLPKWILLGTPIVGDPNGIIVAATSTELPDTETVTYTPDTDGVSPTDGVVGTVTIDGVLYWELDVPRNITSVTTHGSSVVAMTIGLVGLDLYKEPLAETLAVAATGTSQAADGKKAFKYLRSIAITAAADAEANTLNMGFGDVLGLPYRVTSKDHLLIYENLVPVATGTFVAAVDTAATATTGDVRGTLNPTVTLDGTARIAALFHMLDPSSKESLYGVAQFGG